MCRVNEGITTTGARIDVEDCMRRGAEQRAWARCSQIPKCVVHRSAFGARHAHTLPGTCICVPKLDRAIGIHSPCARIAVVIKAGIPDACVKMDPRMDPGEDLEFVKRCISAFRRMHLSKKSRGPGADENASGSPVRQVSAYLQNRRCR